MSSGRAQITHGATVPRIGQIENASMHDPHDVASRFRTLSVTPAPRNTQSLNANGKRPARASADADGPRWGTFKRLQAAQRDMAGLRESREKHRQRVEGELLKAEDDLEIFAKKEREIDARLAKFYNELSAEELIEMTIGDISSDADLESHDEAGDGLNEAGDALDEGEDGGNGDEGGGNEDEDGANRHDETEQELLELAQ